MGKQFQFFWTEEVERDLFAEFARLELKQFDVDSGPFFSFQAPPDDWLDADVVQYSRGFGVEPREARLWTGATNPDFRTLFDRIRQFVRSRATFHKNARIWVWDRDLDEFKRYLAAKQGATRALIEANREYAEKELGARIRKLDE